MKKISLAQCVATACMGFAGLYSSSAFAAMSTDAHGNTGYSTMAECEAAVQSGAAKFYQSFTTKPALLRAGETSVRKMPLGQTTLAQAAGAVKGLCDVGVGHKAGRDGVSKALIGKYVPYSPEMMLNVYSNRAGEVVRVTMEQCDNWFGSNLPKGFVKAAAPVAKAPVQAPAPVVAAAPVAPVVVAPKPMPVPVQVAPAAPVVAASAGLSTPAMVGLGLVAAGVAAAVANSSTTAHHGN